MTWTPTTSNDLDTARAVVTWIRTARAAGYGGPDWWPSDADVAKSALFERLRSGKEPLEFPPPVAFSCPWYAVVEDHEPHYVGNGPGFGPYFYQDGELMGTQGQVNLFQNHYGVVEKTTDQDMVVRDVRHQTPYLFRLWFDADYRSASTSTGGWFLQIIEPTASKEPFS